MLPLGVHGNFWGNEGRHGNKLEVGVSNKLAGEPQERLFEVVVTFCTNVVVLEDKQTVSTKAKML